MLTRCYSRRYGFPGHFDRLFPRTFGTWSSYLNCTSKHCPFMNLTEFRSIATRMRINVMSFHVLTVNASSNRWISISVSISMEGWFSKIGCQGRIRKPSRTQFKIFQFLFQFLLLFLSQLSILLILGLLSHLNSGLFICTCRC